MKPITFFCLFALLPSVAAADDFAAWRHYRSIALDTTATGADVAGDVQNYPLAVALSADNFDFGQAKPDGSDLRVSTEKGAGQLAHSIEHWDQAGRTALVWVKLPLVRGNDNKQSVFIHWGNSAAADASNSWNVFDTAEGFVGVWHLDEDGNTQDDGYRDATANAAHGTGVNLKPGARVDARVGKGLSLNYADTQWVKLAGEKRKLFDLTNSVTFSIWARARSYSNQGNEAQRALPGYETMFAKGDNSWRLQKFGIRGWHKPPAELCEICVEKAPKGDLCTVGTVDMQLDTWYHFTGVHDHPKLRFYVNGKLEKEDTFDSEWTSGDHPVGIGNQSQFPDKGRAWDGLLDEARVMSVVKDANWIKLDYESQREGQKLFSFGEANLQ